MRTSTKLAVPTLLLLSSCYTVGVEISDEVRAQSIGKTKDELHALFGVPHVSSVDSDGVERLGYGLEHRTLMSLDGEIFVEFTLVNGVVTKTLRRFSRPIENNHRTR